LSVGEPRKYEAISTVLFRVHLPLRSVCASDVDVGSELGCVVRLLFLYRLGYVTYITDDAIILALFPGIGKLNGTPPFAIIIWDLV
jgi:hypothetical protein